MHNCITLIPLYKQTLDPLEQFSIDHSSGRLSNKIVYFIGPTSLDFSYYKHRYPNIQIITFEDKFFTSIQGYNRLLLNPVFYTRFVQHEFMLILQTDAILLKDDLTYWCREPFDYIGAPWPDGNELFVNLGQFEGANGRRVRAMVGNGGLSLRRINKCIALLQEFPVALDYFVRTGSSEDLFFAFMGQLSRDFVLPNEIKASLFSLELKPSLYYSMNGGITPMGGHAWWKYDLEFWRKMLPATSELDTISRQFPG
jgi:hypothetical protein